MPENDVCTERNNAHNARQHRDDPPERIPACVEVGDRRQERDGAAGRNNSRVSPRCNHHERQQPHGDKIERAHLGLGDGFGCGLGSGFNGGGSGGLGFGNGIVM